MSWSIHHKKVPAVQAMNALANDVLPDCIRDYAAAGVQALADRHGGGVLVDVVGHGHLCDSPSSYEVTTATLEVKKSDD